MASFAEYDPTIMTTSTSEDDFTLYENFSQAQNFPTTFAYAEHFHAPSTSYESYQSQHAYAAPQFHGFSFGASTQRPDSKFIAQSPTYSPANSTAPSFEFHPPHFSSTSDSGASVQSTISSAIPSPSMSGQNITDWSHTGHMAPAIMQNDNFNSRLFPNDSYDAETVTTSEKAPGCVGESFTVPSSHILSNLPSPSSVTTSPMSFSLPSAAILPQDTVRWPAMPEAFLPIETRTSQGPVAQRLSRGSISSESTFKSPGTPASATRSPRHPLSPIIERVKGQRRASTSGKQKRAQTMSSPLALGSMSAPAPIGSTPNRSFAQSYYFRSPSFSRSSGDFVPPLELSCVFPCDCISFLSFSLSSYFRINAKAND